MKRVLAIFLLLSSLVLAQSLNWEKDYETAIKKAKNENKAILVMVSSPTCPECNYMKKEVFTKKEVNEFVNKNFITFEFDIKDKQIPKQMEFWGIPRFYVTYDGKNVSRKVMGGMKEKNFISFLKK